MALVWLACHASRIDQLRVLLQALPEEALLTTIKSGVEGLRARRVESYLLLRSGSERPSTSAASSSSPASSCILKYFCRIYIRHLI